MADVRCARSTPNGVEVRGGVDRVMRLARCAIECGEEREVKAPASFTVNIELWHEDVLRFIEDIRRRVNYAIAVFGEIHHSMWVPDNLCVFIYISRGIFEYR